ncbi:MAG: RNA polymerase factor sigma-54 [Gemmatimonadetes bacterium]|nr:RNA polymerase factor sigma-54 [Gemmatimonadota bacterium]
MKTGLSQSVRLGQELKINPRLYQAMDMLYMPLLDLQQHLKQELLVNPFLELSDDDDQEDGSEDTGDDSDGTAEEDASADDEADDDAAQQSEADGDQAGDSEDEIETTDIVDRVASTDDSVSDSGDDSDKWDQILSDGFEPEGGTHAQRDDREYFEPVSVATRDLSDHLRDQIQMLELTPRRLLLADEVIGNIGDDGYLIGALEEIRDGINEVVTKAAEHEGREAETLPLFTDAEVLAMLETVQGLDPPGVGARDLRECLLIQLRDAGQAGSLPERLVRDHFDELIAHRWNDIARQIGGTPQDVQAAADEVAKLSPKPGLANADRPDNYVMPDLIVEKVDGEYLVFTNDGNLPRLRLSRSYVELARNRRSLDAEQKEFIASKLNAAQWLVQAIEQRRQTMLKVMHFIVNRQREFFDKGIQYLKPLTLREVADAIDMHESTISRVTNDKYAQTPRGVLPLKFFFSSGLATIDGEDVSARGIKATIESLVKDEDPQRPLTDQAIVDVLEAQGVQIARRTVAKYREQLGVLSARMRKRV